MEYQLYISKYSLNKIREYIEEIATQPFAVTKKIVDFSLFMF